MIKNVLTIRGVKVDICLRHCIMVTCQCKQANSENLCPPPRIFLLKNKESSENVKFIGGVTLTMFIMSTYVDSNNT